MTQEREGSKQQGLSRNFYTETRASICREALRNSMGLSSGRGSHPPSVEGCSQVCQSLALPVCYESKQHTASRFQKIPGHTEADAGRDHCNGTSEGHGPVMARACYRGTPVENRRQVGQGTSADNCSEEICLKRSREMGLEMNVGWREDHAKIERITVCWRVSGYGLSEMET